MNVGIEYHPELTVEKAMVVFSKQYEVYKDKTPVGADFLIRINNQYGISVKLKQIKKNHNTYFKIDNFIPSFWARIPLLISLPLLHGHGAKQALDGVKRYIQQVPEFN